MATQYKIRNGEEDDIRLIKYEGKNRPSVRCPIEYYLIDLKRRKTNEIIGTYFIYGLAVENHITLDIIRDSFYIGYKKELVNLRVKEVENGERELPEEPMTFNYGKIIITTDEPIEDIEKCYFCNIISNIPFSEKNYRFYIYGVEVGDKTIEDVMVEMRNIECNLQIDNLGVYSKN